MSSWIPCVACGKIVPSLSTHEQSCRPSKTREQEMKNREEFLKEFDKDCVFKNGTKLDLVWDSSI